MKSIGIPFIAYYTRQEVDNFDKTRMETAKGVRASALFDVHRGKYKGVLAAGVVAGTLESGDHMEDGGLEGICVGGIATIHEGFTKGINLVGGISSFYGFKGLNLAGVAVESSKDFSGMNVTGGFSDIKGSMDGISMSGLYSYAENLNGISVCGLFSNIKNWAKGIHVSGLFARTGMDLCGMQVGGMVSYVYRALTGISVAALYNHAYASDKFSLQIGAVNRIVNYKGGISIQLGLYNRCGEKIVPGINVRMSPKKLEKEVEGGLK